MDDLPPPSRQHQANSVDPSLYASSGAQITPGGGSVGGFIDVLASFLVIVLSKRRVTKLWRCRPIPKLRRSLSSMPASPNFQSEPTGYSIRFVKHTPWHQAYCPGSSQRARPTTAMKTPMETTVNLNRIDGIKGIESVAIPRLKMAMMASLTMGM